MHILLKKSKVLSILFLLVCSISLAQSPTAPAMKFNIFVKGNTILKSSETEGPVAIGGDLTTNQYQISFDKANGVFFSGGASIGLAVRGGIKLNSGSLTINGTNYIKIGNCTSPTPLKTWYRDNNGAASTIRITESGKSYSSNPNITINASATSFGGAELSDSNNPVCQNVFGTGLAQIDMDGAFTNMISNSAKLATLADNLPIRDQNGRIISGAEVGPYSASNQFGNNPKIIVDPNKVNVLTVSAELWNSINNINIEGIPSGPSKIGDPIPNTKFALIVNIVDFPSFNKKINFPGFGGLNDAQGSYVLYNFPDAVGALSIGGNAQISGTIMAPQAKLTKENNGNINGQIIAAEFVHLSDEIHFWPFQPSVPLPEDKTITASGNSYCEKDAAWMAYTITPNYDAAGAMAKIEWINPSGQVVKTETNQPLNGNILFPGAAVDADGKGIAWPGWVKVDGKWKEVDDLNGSIKQAGSKVRVTLTPSTTFDITYPSSTNTCSTTPTSDTPLPVKLVRFEAENVNCEIQLKWEVAEAENFSHFEVERSSNARSFELIKEITFTSAQNKYSLTDRPYTQEVAQAGTQYYRLKQVDLDGSFEYSNIKAIAEQGCAVEQSVMVYPNPAISEVNVRSQSDLKILEVYNTQSKQIIRWAPKSSTKDIVVPVGGLDSGTYILRVVNSSGQTVSKFYKQ
ncbi:choice-of-anchor A family protein [Dyadobacter tibetensis]|uniref:choice-of-anchor A family protein n=1 Tax=Dyadobacter tibetensis TaxID=1211851 RepID=UPI0004711CD2|nr:choice-of-anchor A family protein [Dyadobacter tibetensis]